ncbi:multifunctional 2',3'-cyclic-nucleotide 2'-phosphodiesterase/5'-nucleotidase/3'-nucleotidase [Sporosarcina sp. ANT_H38]|uniref:5'-nucleotidase C-terminal domain-containing protein n=1 Tax=Sporosarcina sp. ANT_H38 TaxID=2597358 RepID=UPI0011F27E53|nr:5'-nucleotidase C-terminal domain-containing protein [Sporosarcina sp. ANT_H38]KAA0966856.1 multifunctional 2',3'-cyclic-nucleotide 2'-phosphodiesterase/5'-nucleotidase/3'-nucleotidase [Sporosarcina sp. ANT_H38]
MSTKYFKCTATAMLLLSLSAITPVIAAETPVSATGDFSLTVLHTNDTHANLASTAERAALVKKLKAEKPYNVLLDAGDVFSGTLYFNEFKGQADLAVMNYLEYDAMTFGNHEFDLGTSAEGHKALADFIKGAKFPFVGANTNFSADPLFDGLQSKTIEAKAEDGKIYNGIIKEVNGEKVGIFGLTTAETKDISSPEKVTFSNYIVEAKEAVTAFEKAGVNKIIALTHIGYNDSDNIDNDLLLAKNVPGIDIIVGGHTHVKLDEPHVVNKDTEPVVIVQANEYNKFLGQLDITFDEKGVIKDYSGVLHAVGGENAATDADAAKLIKPFSDTVKATMEKPTGATADVFLSGLRDLGGVRAGETNLGNLITDGMLAKAKEIDPSTVIAFQNGGGIRTSIPKGPITYGQAIGVLPFGNSLALIELSGAELKSVFEHSVKDYPKESGGFLHFAGMKLIFDGKAEAGKRVVSITIDGKEIESDKSYKVATNVFTAQGGDGYDMLKKAYEDGRVREPGFVDWESFAEHMKSIGTINSEIEGRISAKVPYSDVAYDSWSYQYVSDLYYRGVLKGSDATYGPKKEMTRAQAASWIVRALDLKAEGTAPFSDIENYAAETKAEIVAAYEHGLIKGVNGKFMPSQKVTRAQFALMLERAYENYTGTKYTAAAKAPYADFGNYDAEAVNSISMLHELGIATGANGKFMPGRSTSREHAAKIVSNFIYNVKQVKKAK